MMIFNMIGGKSGGEGDTAMLTTISKLNTSDSTDSQYYQLMYLGTVSIFCNEVVTGSSGYKYSVESSPGGLNYSSDGYTVAPYFRDSSAMSSPPSEYVGSSSNDGYAYIIPWQNKIVRFIIKNTTSYTYHCKFADWDAFASKSLWGTKKGSVSTSSFADDYYRVTGLDVTFPDGKNVLIKGYFIPENENYTTKQPLNEYPYVNITVASDLTIVSHDISIDPNTIHITTGLFASKECGKVVIESMEYV